jgi:hypothetical protein
MNADVSYYAGLRHLAESEALSDFFAPNIRGPQGYHKIKGMYKFYGMFLLILLIGIKKRSQHARPKLLKVRNA